MGKKGVIKDVKVKAQARVKCGPDTQCKWCGRARRNCKAWRGADGRQCRTCPRLIANNPKYTKDARSGKLQSDLEASQTRREEWLKEVLESEDKWEASASSKSKVLASKEKTASASEVVAIFWPTNVWEREMKSAVPKDRLVRVSIDGVKKTGADVYGKGDGDVVGAITFRNEVGEKLKQDLTLADSDDDDEYKGQVMADASKKLLFKSADDESKGPKLSCEHAVFDEDVDDGLAMVWGTFGGGSRARALTDADDSSSNHTTTRGSGSGGKVPHVLQDEAPAKRPRGGAAAKSGTELFDKADVVILQYSQLIAQLRSAEGIYTTLPNNVNKLTERVDKLLEAKNFEVWSRDWESGEPLTRGMECLNKLQEIEKNIPCVLAFSKNFHDKTVCSSVYETSVTECVAIGVVLNEKSYDEMVRRQAVEVTADFDWTALARVLSDNGTGVANYMRMAASKGVADEKLQAELDKIRLPALTSCAEFLLSQPMVEESAMQRHCARVIYFCDTLKTLEFMKPKTQWIKSLDSLQYLAKFASSRLTVTIDNVAELTEYLNVTENKNFPLWKVFNSSTVGSDLAARGKTYKALMTQDAGYVTDIRTSLKTHAKDLPKDDFFKGNDVQLPQQAKFSDLSGKLVLYEEKMTKTNRDKHRVDIEFLEERLNVYVGSVGDAVQIKFDNTFKDNFAQILNTEEKALWMAEVVGVAGNVVTAFKAYTFTTAGKKLDLQKAFGKRVLGLVSRIQNTNNAMLALQGAMPTFEMIANQKDVDASERTVIAFLTSTDATMGADTLFGSDAKGALQRLCGMVRQKVAAQLAIAVTDYAKPFKSLLATNFSKVQANLITEETLVKDDKCNFVKLLQIFVLRTSTASEKASEKAGKASDSGAAESSDAMTLSDIRLPISGVKISAAEACVISSWMPYIAKISSVVKALEGAEKRDCMNMTDGCKQLVADHLASGEKADKKKVIYKQTFITLVLQPLSQWLYQRGHRVGPVIPFLDERLKGILHKVDACALALFTRIFNIFFDDFMKAVAAVCKTVSPMVSTLQGLVHGMAEDWEQKAVELLQSHEASELCVSYNTFKNYTKFLTELTGQVCDVFNSGNFTLSEADRQQQTSWATVRAELEKVLSGEDCSDADHPLMTLASLGACMANVMVGMARVRPLAADEKSRQQVLDQAALNLKRDAMLRPADTFKDLLG